VYLIRLDDASEYMDVEKWDRVIRILDKYSIKPIIGVIPDNKDPELIDKYQKNPYFWNTVREWVNKGYDIAMHGFQHVFSTKDGGINPVNNRSEFAGLKLELQEKKIEKAIDIFIKNEIYPKIFFAPAHTFDLNTLVAIKNKTNIRIISDTIASSVYFCNDFFFIPQQAGSVREIPFKVVTFCYHPNNMNEIDFKNLILFLEKKNKKFGSVHDLKFNYRSYSLIDRMLRYLYFKRRKKC